MATTSDDLERGIKRRRRGAGRRATRTRPIPTEPESSAIEGVNPINEDVFFTLSAGAKEKDLFKTSLLHMGFSLFSFFFYF